MTFKNIRLFTFLLAIIFTNRLYSQTTLISPSGDGGFENGSTFAANGWTLVTGNTNSWAVGTTTKNSGTNSAYVSNNGGTNYTFTDNITSTSHFYRDVNMPAGFNHIVLSFKIKGYRQYYAGNFYDKFLVYTAPASVTPTNSVPSSPSTTFSGATLVYQQDNDYANYSLVKIVLPSSLAGTTVRLIFTWINDNGNNSGSPASIDDISLITDYRNDWSGSASTDWNNGGNWSQGVPTSLHNIYIPSGVTNLPTLTQAVTVNDIVLNSNINLNNNQLTANGSIACNASFTGSSNSSLILNNANFFDVNSGAISIKMNQSSLGSTNALNTFTINNPNGGSISLGNALRITNALILNNGVLTSNDNITLASDASGTAIVATVTNGASITGKVLVEKYIPARRAFRLMSSPVTSATDIRTNWQEGGSSASGYGTQITGTGGSSNGFDVSQTNNPSLFTHDNNAATWSAVVNPYSTLTAGTAYRLMIRGDRTIDLYNQTPNPTNTVIRTTGTLYTGSKTLSLNSTNNSSKFCMVGNPYQAPVDMQNVLSTNATNIQSNYYYIWDPTLNTRGAYVTIDLTNNTNASGSFANKYLQPGQACFIKTTTSGAASIVFTEASKGSTLTNTFKTTANESYLNVKLYQSDSLLHNAATADAIRLRLAANYSNAIDEMDATKASNQDENLAINTNGQWFGMEARSMPLNSDTLHLDVNQYRSTNYTFKVEANSFSNLQAVLIDKYNQNRIAINSNSVATLYSFSVDASIPASVASDRFLIEYKPIVTSTSTMSNNSNNAVLIYPNPSDGNMLSILFNSMEGKESTLSIVNILNQVVYKCPIKIETSSYTWTSNPNLKSGFYQVQIEDKSGSMISQKLIIK